jgi:hypothetical protein
MPVAGCHQSTEGHCTATLPELNAQTACLPTSKLTWEERLQAFPVAEVLQRTIQGLQCPPQQQDLQPTAAKDWCPSAPQQHNVMFEQMMQFTAESALLKGGHRLQ